MDGVEWKKWGRETISQLEGGKNEWVRIMRGEVRYTIEFSLLLYQNRFELLFIFLNNLKKRIFKYMTIC